MNTRLSSFPVGPPGTPQPRPLDDQLADFVNVKDWGAVGDGVTDDGPVIQNALNHALSDGSGNWTGAGHVNRPVIFPAGDYLVRQTLYVQSVSGSALLLGQGSRTTRIIYDGTFPNPYPASQTSTNLFFANGFGYSRVEGISFIMPSGHNAQADNTVCFNWNWDASIAGFPSNTIWMDCGFSGGTHGFAGGLIDGPFGNQCDSSCWVNCWFDSCYNGLTLHGYGNTINCGVFGGRVTNCSNFGINAEHGPMGIITGVYFKSIGNYFDWQEQAGPSTVIGCYSDSTNFGLTGYPCEVIGCTHTGSGYFMQTSTGSPYEINSCVVPASVLYGTGTFFIRETQFGNPAWNNLGIIAELSNPPLTYATLPVLPSQGLLVSITDSSVTTWGSTAAGGGSNRVLLNSSRVGGNPVWRVVGR